MPEASHARASGIPVHARKRSENIGENPVTLFMHIEDVSEEEMERRFNEMIGGQG